MNLEKLTLVGKGLHRECYVHPDHHNLCIKVLISNENHSEVKREMKYYSHLLKRNISWDMIPKFHGTIQTSIGVGYIFDLILDHTGNVSKTFEYYLSCTKSNQIDQSALNRALIQLKKYLLENRIITMTLHPKNICCQINQKGEIRLYIVDNIGNSDLIPICNFIPYFAKRKIIRKWKRFEALMSKVTEHS
jgi:hypothetical protein